MRKILYIALFSVLAVSAKAQITINTPFEVNSNNPIDIRETIATDADTANVDFKYPTMRVRSDASDAIFEWTGTRWVNAGTVYSVGTQAELSDLPCNVSNWAYVSGENAWHYCDGGSWVKGSKPSLTEDVTYYVCNDTCQYKSIGAALDKLTNLQVPYDSTRINGTVEIVRNSDGTPTVLSELVHLKEEQDLGWVHITSNDDTVYYNKPPSAPYLFRAEFTQFPRLINLHVISQNNDGQFLSASLQSQATVNSCIIEDFESGIYGFKSELAIDGNQFKNLSSRAIFLDLHSRAYIRSCTADNVSQLAYIDNGAEAYLLNNTVRNYTSQGVFLSDGFAHIDGGDYRADGTNDNNNDIFINEGNICVMTGGVLGGTNQPANKISDAGIITRTGEPTPFMEASTAAEPAASSGIRFYWNTDCNCLKVSDDNLTWKDQDTPDTLIIQFPLLKYTGNAADTLASNQTYYFNPVNEAIANREIVRFEVNTTKNVAQDLGFWIYEEDLDAATSAQVLPDGTPVFFTLSSGTRQASWDTSDPELSSATPFTLGEMMYLETLLGSADGAGGLEDYEATEGANGLYITLYLTE